MEKVSFLQVRCGKYGWQVVIIDPADRDFLVGARVTFERGQARWIVDNPDGKGGGISLHRLVALRHVKRPSPEHKYACFRNGCANDCRAANLYWATRFQTGRGNTAEFKEKMARVTISEPAA